MKKLICTPFTYTVPSWFPTWTGEHRGSYLGHKPATLATLRRFLRKVGIPSDARIIAIGEPYVSEWTSKV